ncbi:metalloregulator ArsR/SmtB family transcription factor [Polynucleobacter sp. HIN9]|uniref:ArsR/SmtB family transcription factor n=1 Tax=Polynucleobacter sp. HIN9 TaxID=3047868 RepID=UPI0025737024|nr:metalloregulator ArsR/SmtB family transcription factor [Polynucleobacter sp. HIN9]BEI41021.1 metalloregulator ArsR/SmtB family transcription factor [Polynucleobacter sp. HIN9]
MSSPLPQTKNSVAQGFADGLSKKHLSPEQMETLFKEVSAFFAVLAEPSRLRIMYALCEGEKSVSEVIEYSKSSQANVSRHLGTLHQAGILARRKVGTTVYYSICDDATLEICQRVCGRVMNELS